jgi:hypothetical protein
MMTISSSTLEHILPTHIPPPRRKNGDGPLVQQEIYFKTKNSKATPPAQTACLPALMVGVEVNAVDFEPGEDDLMDYDT